MNQSVTQNILDNVSNINFDLVENNKKEIKDFSDMVLNDMDNREKWDQLASNYDHIQKTYLDFKDPHMVRDILGE